MPTRKLETDQKKLEGAIEVLRRTWRAMEEMERGSKRHSVDMTNIEAILKETQLALRVMLSASQDAVKAHKSGNQTKIEQAMHYLDGCVWEQKHCAGDLDKYDTENEEDDQ